MTSTSPVILVLGVGPGLGMSVAQRFGTEGYAVGLVSPQRRPACQQPAIYERSTPCVRHFGPIDVGYYGPA
jgi:NAD(P)-dependent dehydrogenase (short-subunit alcohol dehydrogenase family)